MKTDMATLATADWDSLEREVVGRIRLIRAMAEHLDSNEINDQIAQDLILPNVALLAKFCTSVKIEE